jgi:MFS family permease
VQDSPQETHPTAQVLATPAVRFFLLARFATIFGRSLIAAMLSYHLFVVTDSYAILGLLGLVEFLPVIPVSLLAGVVADRVDRRTLLLNAAFAGLTGSAVLTWIAWQRPESVPALMLVAFALAIVVSFSRPAGSALLPNLVPAAIFQQAVVVESCVAQVALITGPITMGFLVALFGLVAPYALATIFYVLAILFLFLLHAPPTRGTRSPLSWQAAREGISFVWNHQPILGSVTLDMFAVIFAGATALLPVYAEEILQVGPEGYGFLRAAMAVGAFSMALALMVLRPFARPGRALFVAVFFFGVATIVFGFSRSLPLSLVAFVVAGMADQVSVTARSVILQLSTPDELRGRVSSVNFIFIGASNELGDAESGFFASLTSATFAVVAGGFACLGVLGWVGVRMPELRDYRPSASL